MAITLITGNAVSDILLCKRFDTGNSARVGTSELQVSWELNQPGQLSCRIPLTDLTAAGLGGDLKGYWVRYEHPKCGAWGGVVQTIGRQDGVIELAVHSFTVLAQARIINLKGFSGDVAAVFKRVLALADSDQPTGLVWTDANAHFGGWQIGTNWTDADLFTDVIPLLTDDAGYWWWVDADRAIFYRQKQPLSTQTPTIALAQPVEIAQPHWADDLSTIVNDLTVHAQGISSKTKRGNKKSKASGASLHDLTPFKGRDQASVDAYGLRQAVQNWQPITTQKDLNTYGATQLALLKDPTASASFTIADQNSAWSDIREDVVASVNLGTEGVQGLLHVESRALDVAAGTLLVGGTVWRTQ